MDMDLRPSKNLFVIPDNDQFILYEPCKPSVLVVNRATINILEKIRKGSPTSLDAHSDVIKQLVSHGVIVDKKDDHEISFPNDRASFNPQGVSLLLTAACSMRCIYCYGNGGDTPKQMPWPIAKTAIDWIVRHARVKQKRRLYISLHGGGEVTVAADLMKRCVSYVRRHTHANGIKVQIEAGLNGVMDRDVTDWVIDNIDGATISLDGPPEVQNAQRPLVGGRNSYEVVETALRRMDARGFNYSIRMTVTHAHCHKMADSVVFIASKFRVKNIQVEPVCLVGRALEKGLAPVDGTLFVDQFRKAKEVTDGYGVELKYSGARFQTHTNVFCKTATGDAFAVTPEGYVTSCYEVSDPDDPRASLFFFGQYDPATGQFKFDPEKIEKLRSLSVENKSYCNNCFCKWHCAGDCPAKLASRGDAWNPEPNPRCYINRELTKDQIKELLR